MNGLATKNAPNVRLPLEFMVTGIAGYLVLQAVLLPQAGQIFGGQYLQPGVVATVHLATLGWASMVMLGAYHQLVPVLLQVDIHSERLGHAAFWLYLPGTALLILGFWKWFLPAIILGGSLVFAGIVLFLANMALTLRRVRHWNLQAKLLAVALAFLLNTAFLGLTLALNFRFGFISRSVIGHMAFHFIGGIGGWFTLTIIAVGYRLIPMFTLAHGYPEGWQRPVAWLAALGTAGTALAAGYGRHGGVLLLAAVPVAAGLALFAFDVLRIVRHRRRRSLDLVTRYMTASLVAMVLAAMVAGALVIRPAAFPVPPSVAATASMYLFLMGWVSLIIVGHLYKIVPFLIWLHRYAHRAGREAVPLVGDLYSRRVGDWSFRLITTGTFGTAGGVLAGWPGLAQAAQGVALAGTALFGWAMLQVLLGLRHVPRRRADDPRPAVAASRNRS